MTAVEATEVVVMMVGEEMEAETRAEAVMVVAAMAEESMAEAAVDEAVTAVEATEVVVMEAAATSAAREAAEMAVEMESAARDAEEMAVEMEVAAREEASAAVIWEVGNQEGHSNGHSPLQRGSSPYSACAMMQRRCTPVGTVSRRKTSRALQSYEPTRREMSPSAHEASHSTRQLERNVRAHIVQRDLDELIEINETFTLSTSLASQSRPCTPCRLTYFLEA